MIEIDVDGITGVIDAEAPSGPNLEYDPDFVEMERLFSVANAALSEGAEVGEEVDWTALGKLALGLMTRTRDLRVAIVLCQAGLMDGGLRGYRQGLEAVRRLVETQWPDIHPQLDPDDDNDPTMRMNVLSALADGGTALKLLRETPLVSSRALGRFSWRDILLSTGELTLPEGSEDEPPKPATVEAAVMDADIGELMATADDVGVALTEARSIEALVTEEVGAGSAVSLEDLRRLLGAMHKTLQQYVASRTGVPIEGEDPTAGPQAAAGQAAAPGEIRSRDDVVRTLDRVIDYYRKFEPTSPVPLLMRRAKRLARMDFMDIIRDLAPDAITSVETIRGPDEGE
jgi:type VI secretion system protein ImpA